MCRVGEFKASINVLCLFFFFSSIQQQLVGSWQTKTNVCSKERCSKTFNVQKNTCLFVCLFVLCVLSKSVFFCQSWFGCYLVCLRLELNCWNCPFVLSAASTKPNVNMAKEHTFEHTFRKSTQTNVCSFKHIFVFVVNSLVLLFPTLFSPPSLKYTVSKVKKN